MNMASHPEGKMKARELPCEAPYQKLDMAGGSMMQSGSKLAEIIDLNMYDDMRSLPRR